VPCFGTNARKGAGVEALKQGIAQALEAPRAARVHVRYPPALITDIDHLAQSAPEFFTGSVERKRALALWALCSVEPDDELEGIPSALRESCLTLRRTSGERDLDLEIVGNRYAAIDARLPELFARVDAHPPKRKLSERADRILLHPLLGFVCFVSVMLVLFQALALIDAAAQVGLTAGTGSILAHFGPTERAELLVSAGAAVILIPLLIAVRDAFPARLYPASRRAALLLLSGGLALSAALSLLLTEVFPHTLSLQGERVLWALRVVVGVDTGRTDAEPTTREERMIEHGYSQAPGRDANAAEYPAHLHIDLLPETQGQGLGRALIETLFAELSRRGVRGLHLGMDPKNTGAAAFYERLGMTPLPAEPGGQSYGVRFA
jgi:GNAT superfamily N-acetyltransferase